MSRRLQPAASSSRICARLLQRRRVVTRPVPHGAQPGPEPPGGHDLLPDQARRLEPRAAQPVFGPVERERGPAGHVRAEVSLIGGLGPAKAQRADRGGLAGQQSGLAGIAGQDALLLPFAGAIRVVPGHQAGQPARVLLGQPGHPDRHQSGVVAAVQNPGGHLGPRRPQADQGQPRPAGRGDPLPDEPRLGRRTGLHQQYRFPGAQQAGQLAHDGTSPSSVAGQSASSSR